MNWLQFTMGMFAGFVMGFAMASFLISKHARETDGHNKRLQATLYNLTKELKMSAPNDDFPFKCNECDQIFATNDGLDSHLYVAHQRSHIRE
jgi:hypothetical protein